ncbi:MAG: hypothetical protein WCJ71_06085 [Candidatus Omnitrophota bacterium]
MLRNEGRDSDADKKRAEQSGISAYRVKPFDLKLFHKTIHS